MKVVSEKCHRVQLTDESAGTGVTVPFTLEQFRTDILRMILLQAKLIDAMADNAAALRFIDKPNHGGHIDFSDATQVNLKYEDIRDYWLVMSLEAMYRYAYFGEVDEHIEELGPGGYHITIAAIVKDMAESRLLNFFSYVEGVDYKTSVENCLRTAELANARLTLEGEPRFFNFDGKDEDYDSLINGGTVETPQGGYGAALTIRQFALLSGIGEMSIRTAANPKRPNHIPTETRSGRTVITIEVARNWLKKKGRYLPIRRGTDGAVLDLMKRGFSSTRDLFSVVLTRLTVLDHEANAVPSRMTLFKELGDRYAVTSENKTAYGNVLFLNELAALLMFPPDLFLLRVRETLLSEEMQTVRRAVREAVQNP